MPDSGLSAAQDLARLGKKNLLVAFSTTPYSTETVRLIKLLKHWISKHCHLQIMLFHH